MPIVDELRKKREDFISKEFFVEEEADGDVSDSQRRGLDGTLNTCEVRYQTILDHKSAPTTLVEFQDNRDVVAMYLMFRSLEYARECLNVRSIYGLLPLVRCLYEHMLKIHWAIKDRANCQTMAEAWRYSYLKRHIQRFTGSQAYRTAFRARHSQDEIAQVQKEFKEWTGRRTFPSFTEIAKDVGLEQVFPEDLYALLSNRAHGSDGEEFFNGTSAVNEFNSLLGVGRILLEVSMDAVEDFVLRRSQPVVSSYSHRLLYEE